MDLGAQRAQLGVAKPDLGLERRALGLARVLERDHQVVEHRHRQEQQRPQHAHERGVLAEAIERPRERRKLLEHAGTHRAGEQPHADRGDQRGDVRPGESRQARGLERQRLAHRPLRQAHERRQQRERQAEQRGLLPRAVRGHGECGDDQHPTGSHAAR